MADIILRANPSEIDHTALDHLIDQIPEPSAWPGSSPLPRALGHIGSRAIIRLGERIRGMPPTADHTLAYRMSEHLLETVRQAGSAKVDDSALGAIESLLDDPRRIVRVKIVEALGELGPRARGALPRIEPLFEATLKEKRQQTLIMGPTQADVIGMAISKIKGEPVKYDY